MIQKQVNTFYTS